MDNLDTKSPTQLATDDLQAQCDALRHLVVSMLVLVVVISGTLNIYFLRQYKTLSKELAAIRPQFNQMNAVYQKDEAPWMQDIVRKLTEYGRAHPAFAPILTKYNLKPGGPTGAMPTTPTPQQPAALLKK
jgi:hypothetical protein